MNNVEQTKVELFDYIGTKSKPKTVTQLAEESLMRGDTWYQLMEQIMIHLGENVHQEYNDSKFRDLYFRHEMAKENVVYLNNIYSEMRRESCAYEMPPVHVCAGCDELCDCGMTRDESECSICSDCQYLINENEPPRKK